MVQWYVIIVVGFYKVFTSGRIRKSLAYNYGFLSLTPPFITVVNCALVAGEPYEPVWQDRPINLAEFGVVRRCREPPADSLDDSPRHKIPRAGRTARRSSTGGSQRRVCSGTAAWKLRLQIARVPSRRRGMNEVNRGCVVERRGG